MSLLRGLTPPARRHKIILTPRLSPYPPARFPAMTPRIRTAFWVLLAAGLAGPRAASAQTPSAQATEFFEARVRPVLADNCFSCHGPKRQRGGLRLDSAASLRKGGDSGAVVVPGHPEKSPLIQAVRHAGERKMPPEKKLPAQAVADLAAWVQMAAPWPGRASPAQAPDG